MKTSAGIDSLVHYQKRQFINENVDFTRLEDVNVIFQALVDKEINSAADLESWLLYRSEVEAALEEVGSLLYIRTSCNTDDEKIAKAYEDFIRNIAEAVHKWDHQLNVKYLEAAKKYALDQKRYGIYHRSLETDFKLFRDENVPLGTKLSLLSQEYQTIMGKMSVHFEGKEQTLPQMGKYLQEPDRDLRERAWKATSERLLQDREKLENLFNEMVKIRHQMALNAGFSNFVDYQFESYHRFDYKPEDCKKYHQSVEKLLVPLWKKILDAKAKDMKLSVLRPWDLGVDPKGRPPLKPFQVGDELIKGCHRIFEKVDPELGSQFKEMMGLGLLDLDSRKGKAPGGYMSTLQEARRPFIFMNSVGLDSDVRTLLHETGHAFHALACRKDPLVSYRHAPIEFSEVASMAMELLGGEYISEFYNKEDAHRSYVEHLEDIVFVLTWVATVDCFQQWVYEHPDHSPEERKQCWISIRKRFGGSIVDWSGLEEAYGYGWHRQLHIFEAPLYYIEYGIAQLGALGLWHNAKKDWRQAVADYRHGLSLGGSRPLPELYSASGIRFNFSEEIIAPLAATLEKALEKN